jgi:RNA 3'-phosphate cyclase
VIRIDGSLGEGGGQVLRTALSLAVITGKPVTLEHIRQGRKKPGLMAQHLKAVDAAAAISRASVEGAALGSTELRFEPGEIRSGRYRFEIGTAGSALLVLQTIFTPLSLASSASSIIIYGGTHVPWSPCFHYVDLLWLPMLRRIGFDALLKLDLAGFYPQGGGRISATIRPAATLRPLILTQRGASARVSGISAVANLPVGIAERQKRQAVLRLEATRKTTGLPAAHIRTLQLPSKVKGTFLLLLAQFENTACCYTSLGELHKPAERVADQAVDALLRFMDSGGAIDQYLADQLLLPLSLVEGESQFHTCQVTSHLLTNAEIIRLFLPVEIVIQGEEGSPGLVRVHASGIAGKRQGGQTAGKNSFLSHEHST